jgi:superfamily II DNA/RNA helicase
MTFKELGLDERLLEALSYMGFESATPIQEQAIPHIVKGSDMIACAQTGTGKTAAFILPVLQRLIGSDGKHVHALVIAPTRELAMQIEQQIQAFAYFLGISSIAIYGGGDGAEFSLQKKALEQGTHIIVATPGKLISHLNMSYTDFSEVEVLILDEADRMLDMGFYEDIVQIVSHLPKKRQNLMFSATMPSKIRQLAKATLNDPVEISMAMSKPAEGVLQAAYLAHDTQKPDLIRFLIDEKPNYKSILIFSSTKKKVHIIAKTLHGKGYNVRAITSDLDQKEREEALRLFRSRNTRVLVGTDVVSRGIDIKDIDLVINYDVPGDAEDYVHRVGRTARAASTGVALTLINPDDMYKFSKIEELIGMEVIKLKIPASIGESPVWSTKYRAPSRGGHQKGGPRKGGGGKGGGRKNYSKKRGR